MKKHSTNYENTFIEVAEDCPVSAAAAPPPKPQKTIAEMQYEMISKHPYRYSSDDVIFECYVQKNDIPQSEKLDARNLFFSKGQACLRSSPLTKRYGFGVHSDKNGKIALYPVESEEYRNFLKDDSIKKVKAMRSKRS